MKRKIVSLIRSKGWNDFDKTHKYRSSMLLPKKKSLSSFCLNCFPSSTLDLKSCSFSPSAVSRPIPWPSAAASCPSSSLQKKKVHRSRSSPRSRRSATARASSPRTETRSEYLSKFRVLGWQHLSSRDRVDPASEGPEETEPVIIEGHARNNINNQRLHALYNSAPTLQKGTVCVYTPIFSCVF